MLMVPSCLSPVLWDVPAGRGSRADRESGVGGADVTGLHSAPLRAAGAMEISRKKCFEDLSKRLFRE